MGTQTTYPHARGRTVGKGASPFRWHPTYQELGWFLMGATHCSELARARNAVPDLMGKVVKATCFCLPRSRGSLVDKTGNDPAAGSPTATLLRLLLPLAVKYWASSAGEEANDLEASQDLYFTANR